METDLHYKMFISVFHTGENINVDYEVPIPDELSNVSGYFLVGLKVSNIAGGISQPLDSFFDINYVGKMKTNKLYQITNSACCNRSARAIWVYF